MTGTGVFLNRLSGQEATVTKVHEQCSGTNQLNWLSQIAMRFLMFRERNQIENACDKNSDWNGDLQKTGEKVSIVCTMKLCLKFFPSYVKKYVHLIGC